MDNRTRIILEDELQTLWEDSLTAKKEFDKYHDKDNADFNEDVANELHDEWIQSYSKYAYLYGLIERMGYGIKYPNNRFQIRK